MRSFLTTIVAVMSAIPAHADGPLLVIDRWWGCRLCKGGLPNTGVQPRREERGDLQSGKNAELQHF
jgi:hypothetical protein